jgi:hypothetical protein
MTNWFKAFHGPKCSPGKELRANVGWLFQRAFRAAWNVSFSLSISPASLEQTSLRAVTLSHTFLDGLPLLLHRAGKAVRCSSAFRSNGNRGMWRDRVRSGSGAFWGYTGIGEPNPVLAVVESARLIQSGVIRKLRLIKGSMIAIYVCPRESPGQK